MSKFMEQQESLCTKSTGAYSSLPMNFGALMVCAPAIVLDNQDYDILIGNSFLQKPPC